LYVTFTCNNKTCTYTFRQLVSKPAEYTETGQHCYVYNNSLRDVYMISPALCEWNKCFKSKQALTSLGASKCDIGYSDTYESVICEVHSCHSEES
jgi:hypothetical protein